MNGSKIALFAAAALGIAGAALNLAYLTGKAQQAEKVSYIGIRKGAIIRRGDRFSEDHLVPIDIPKSHVGNLERVAIRYADRGTVVGMSAVKDYEGDELLLRGDLDTPPATLELKSTERAMWIPVDTRTFVPSLVNPGDLVSFLVGDAPTPAMPSEAPGNAEDGDTTQPPLPAVPLSGRGELIGPFRVLSVGNRLGRTDVLKASGVPQLQENVITISVTVQGDQLEPKAAKLWKMLHLSGSRQAGVILHPSTKN
ncbi:MAG TPA: hypothetical protein VFB80_06770 [Pirellulaceae bacterium]|nr:hypothetical protein [Pirellulaceae bacterium]